MRCLALLAVLALATAGRAGFAAGVGGTMLLPALAPFLISAVSLDVQGGEDAARAALSLADFNSPMPIALSVGYRHRHELYGHDALLANELDAGAYIILRGLHLGVEALIGFDGSVTALVRVDNYSDVAL